ncbi:ribosome biogenesis GTPase YqeH [Virgibacillus sp. W0181]|uniref:ribosome biogenesis GTPase YqeH n=1 Tax=Virgibacillus sp. W0181 TaxID=3391581 RepID=UPI003F46D29B
MDYTIYCQGCGAAIQTDNPDAVGYMPKTSSKSENILCQRCFRLKHYNEVQEVEMTDDDFLSMVSHIRDKEGLIIHIIDIFDTEGSLLKSLPRITGNNPILLVGNKMDLLPKSTNKRKLVHWIRSLAKDAGLDVADVYLISAEKGHGLEELAFQIEAYRNKKDVYVVGVTNAGKSTFINRLIKRSTGEKDVITTSYFPGTTLGFIKIPLDRTTSLIDTPGIVNKRQMAHYVSDHDLKLITPKNEIKSRTYQLDSGQTLFFGGLARFEFIKGEKQSFVCYFSNRIPIHRTKLENANNLFEKQVGELLSPPSKETLKLLPDMEESTYKIKEDNIDVVFPGLGWISIKKGNATIRVYSPKGVSVSLRKSFM